MQTTYIKPQDLPECIHRCFAYSGKQVQLITASSVHLNNFWSGGSRSWYKAVELATGKVTEAHPDTANPFKPEEHVDVPLRPGVVIVEMQQVSDRQYLKAHALPGDLAAALPAPVELTRDERIVLIATRSHKNSYGGEKNIRYREAHRYTGITSERWEAVKAALIQKGLLNKAGAITLEGKNAVGDDQLWQMRESA
jgi:hypothetical protein